jgi:hypothetical protein
MAQSENASPADSLKQREGRAYCHEHHRGSSNPLYSRRSSLRRQPIQRPAPPAELAKTIIN